MITDVARSLLAEPILSGAATDRLILAVGPLRDGAATETLEIGVHNAAVAFAMARPTPDARERVVDAEGLADACRMVLVRLGIAVEGRRKDRSSWKPVAWRSLKPSLGPRALYTGGQPVLDAIEAVRTLERMASNVADHFRVKAEAESAALGAPKNAALGPLFRNLEELYFDLWDDLPALARSSRSGNWREAEEAEGATAESYLTGNEIPVRFLRLLTELFSILAQRGLDVPQGSAAIEQACRRWRREQRKAALEGMGEESMVDMANRLVRGDDLGA